ncbi:MAG TPA: LnmK family bifunctional acyltransferase/decarboxylase [Chitinophagaceae bacterium]
MSSYLLQIQELLPEISEADLRLPLQEGCIDSIDLVCIRALLEKRVGELPDVVWNQFTTVQQAIDYCEKEDAGQGLAAEAEPVLLQREHEINMPQMARGCLSEHWLFKELGDLHWVLLAAGLGTPSGELKDNRGARLYATFVRIQMVHDPLYSFRENEKLNLQGALRRFGVSTYISQVEGSCSGKGLNALLMTTFSARVEGNNTALLKSEPLVRHNGVSEYVLMPTFLRDYRLLRKGLLEEFLISGIPFSIAGEVLFETEYDIHPYYEINGVGLLYFAAYPVISDVGEASYFNQIAKERHCWEDRYSTTVRDVFYFANCNSDDRVVYQLNSVDPIEEDKIRLCSTLYRKSDGALMARLFTVKKVKPENRLQ